MPVFMMEVEWLEKECRLRNLEEAIELRSWEQTDLEVSQLRNLVNHCRRGVVDDGLAAEYIEQEFGGR
jgi:hypothetical protein